MDDDPQTLRFVRSALEAEGYSLRVTGDPRQVSHLIRAEKPRLILLDLMLPGIDGIELMERVPEMANLPTIFISGYKRDETIVRALDVGAADYILKPFSPTELAARIRAVLRRRYESAELFRLGKLAIQYEKRKVTLDGRPLNLTAIEYDLLRTLSVNAGKTLAYDSLLRQIWGRKETRDVRPVRTIVKKLRRKLGDNATNPLYIINERQVGYRMGMPDDL